MRNDVCFHDLPVYIVGNGGGYHYGALGSSHHTLEDIATLSGLPNIRCYVPAFIEDMNACMDEMLQRRHPAYLRLGVGKSMPQTFQMTEWGGYQSGPDSELTILVQSPVANNALSAIEKLGCAERVDVFYINRMPLELLSQEILRSVSSSGKMLTIEEHVAVGGLGSSVALLLSKAGVNPGKFVNLNAHGYPNGLYGNQAYHQEVNELDATGIASHITQLLS
jgi:transketolase